MCWFCTFHRSHMCLYVDCESFKLALWPALRQKFMNFWSFLTRSGDKHDKKISNCSSTPRENSIEFCHRYTFIHGSHSIDHEYDVKMQDGSFFLVICLFLTWQDQLLILLKPTLYLALENNSFIHFFVPYLKENLRSVQSTGKGKRWS